MFGLPFLKRRENINQTPRADLAQRARVIKPRHPRQKAGASIKSDYARISFPADYGYYERITLYRFLREQIPVVNGAIWTWVRLCSSPMVFHPSGSDREADISKINSAVDDLNLRLAPNPYYKSGGLERLSDLFFSSLFVDGAFAGNVEASSDGQLSGFLPVDVRKLTFEYDDGWKIYHESAEGKRLLDPVNFIYIPLDDDSIDPRGKSVLQSIGFVSRLEQKLLDDMQKSQEKAGYNRLHVLIKKPERRMGESENDFCDRANSYFDDTVGLFSGIKPSDSVVTWDDIEIKTVGPSGGATTATHSWYLSHRAVVEDVCAGVHLDPFMLGYSYGNTRSWARFKFELVLRQVVSVQKLAVRFFEWLVNTHLALSGVNLKASVSFNNDRINGALERYQSEHEEARRVLGLYEAGLLSKEEARARIFRIEGGN
jgi:hypothetical protein